MGTKRSKSRKTTRTRRSECCTIFSSQISERKKQRKIAQAMRNFDKNTSRKSPCSACIQFVESFACSSSPKDDPSASEEKNESCLNSGESEEDIWIWNTVIINQLPSTTDIEKLLSVFSQYGAVEDVHVDDACEMGSSADLTVEEHGRIARVRFRHERDTERVWEAYQEGLVKLDDDVLMITLVPDNSPIQNLPDNCLREIFSYLPVEALRNIEKVRKRWEKVGFESWSNVRTIEESYTSTSWKIIAPRLANNLRNRAITLPDKNPVDKDENNEDSPCETLKLISEHFTNLETLTIVRDRNQSLCFDKKYSEDVPYLNSILSKNVNLKKLYLNQVIFPKYSFVWINKDIEVIHICSEYSSNRGPTTLGSFSRFLKLQELKLENYWIHEGQLMVLDHFVNMKVLDLSQCAVDPSNVEMIVHLEKLEHLAIPGCQISNNILLQILRSNEDLKYLDISGIKSVRNSALRCICQLPKLENLIMRGLRSVTYLNAIPHLKSLKADDCSSLTNEAIRRLFIRNSMIEHLSIARCSVSFEILRFAGEWVKTRGEGKTLNIVVGQRLYQEWMSSERNSNENETDGQLFVFKYGNE